MIPSFARARRARLFVVAVGAATVTVVGAFMFTARAESHPSVGGLSNHGQLVAALATSQQQQLTAWGLDREVSELADRGRMQFFTGTSSAKKCYLESNADAPTPEFSFSACVPADSTLLTATQPLIDFSAYWKRPATGPLHVRWLSGIAADGIDAVGVLRADGSVASKVPVINNVYYTRDVPNDPISALVAFDAGGAIVFTQEMH